MSEINEQARGLEEEFFEEPDFNQQQDPLNNMNDESAGLEEELENDEFLQYVKMILSKSAERNVHQIHDFLKSTMEKIQALKNPIPDEEYVSLRQIALARGVNEVNNMRQVRDVCADFMKNTKMVQTNNSGVYPKYAEVRTIELLSIVDDLKANGFSNTDCSSFLALSYSDPMTIRLRNEQKALSLSKIDKRSAVFTAFELFEQEIFPVMQEQYKTVIKQQSDQIASLKNDINNLQSSLNQILDKIGAQPSADNLLPATANVPEPDEETPSSSEMPEETTSEEQSSDKEETPELSELEIANNRIAQLEAEVEELKNREPEKKGFFKRLFGR